MLADIHAYIVTIGDWFALEWSHAVDYLQSIVSLPEELTNLYTYIPSFLVPFIASFVSILIVRKVINR